MGVNESSTALAAPVPVPVVAAAKSAAPACPKRRSFPLEVAPHCVDAQLGQERVAGCLTPIE